MTLRETADMLEQCDYPLSADELSAVHGEWELELPNGSETLADVLERAGDEQFDSAEEARHAVYGAVCSDAVGRIGYSDRDPTPMGVDGPTPVSF